MHHCENVPAVKATMVFQTYIPHKPLSTFIDYLWFYSGYNPPGAKELNLPEAAVDLIIDLCEDKFRIHNRHRHDMKFHPIVVCGPQSDYFVTQNSNKRVMMGAHFRCGGAGAFLRVLPMKCIICICLCMTCGARSPASCVMNYYTLHPSLNDFAFSRNICSPFRLSIN